MKRMGTVEEVKSTATAGAPNGRQAKTRSSYSLTPEVYDYVWKEAARHGCSMTDALNFLIDEIQQWRSGARRFVERRRQTR